MQSAQIDQWLKMWHSWASSVRATGGYPGTAAGCGMYRASKQYDDTNGALDAAADIAEAEAVDAVINKLHPIHRAALSMEARNLCTVRVWQSARIAQEDVQHVTAEARKLLWQGMDRAGLADTRKAVYY